MNLWFLGQRFVQLSSTEYFITKNHSSLSFKIERLQFAESQAEVSWKIVPKDLTETYNFGTVYFENGESQKHVTVELSNIADQKLPFQIELYNPTNHYQLGKNKVANISLVCEYHIVKKGYS